jgi:hypothetical protein
MPTATSRLTSTLMTLTHFFERVQVCRHCNPFGPESPM